MSEVLVKRSDKVAFYGVPGVGAGLTVYHRMTGFTDSSISKNSKEYSRQYVDEDSERTDVTGFSPSMAYGFDQYVGNPVHDDIVALSDNETLGSAAVRSIIIVDLTDFTTVETVTTYAARKRDYTVVPDSEGGSLDAYTYSGNFKSNGSTIKGTATLDAEKKIVTFTAA